MDTVAQNTFLAQNIGKAMTEVTIALSWRHFNPRHAVNDMGVFDQVFWVLGGDMNGMISEGFLPVLE